MSASLSARHGRREARRSSLPRPVVLATVAALLGAAVAAGPAAASTATTTTLDVPGGTQYGLVSVTAHVRPAPQPENGFIPAVMFQVDGGGGGIPAPIDANGDASTQVSLSVGSHQIVAAFLGFGDWGPSASDPADVRVGIATTTTLEASPNPGLSTVAVTIKATVSPEVSGGTLSIVDAFDGTTLASGSVGPGASSVSVTRTLAAGDHPLTATYSGAGDDGPSDARLTETIQPDTSVDATTGVWYATFYPYKDGYRDTNGLVGTLREPASVVLTIFSPTNAVIRKVDLGARAPGDYRYQWTGRSSTGAMLPAGRYRVEQRLTDTADNVKTTTHYVTLSHKKLVWTSATITLAGSRYAAHADGGNGYISTSRSAYTGGVKLSSGTAGVAVAYKFTVRSAVVYSPNVTFKVLGRSPSGTTVIEGLWNRAYCSPQYVGCYDARSMGPGYAWWSIAGSSGLHLEARTAYGLVEVPYTGRVRSFDIAKVRLVYRWAVLG